MSAERVKLLYKKADGLEEKDEVLNAILYEAGVNNKGLKIELVGQSESPPPGRS